MQKNVVVIGAGDAAGKRITADFIKRGFRVFAGYEESDTPQNSDAEAYGINPFCHQSLLSMAEAVAEKTASIDMLVINLDRAYQDDGSILEPQNFDALLEAYELFSVAPLRAVNAFYPLLSRGEGKRICVVTTKDSSNNLCEDTSQYVSHVARAPLNMAMNLLFNGLRPEGYTFRMYCKDTDAEPSQIGAYAAEYFIRNRSNEPWDPKHSDENRMVLRDSMGRELPW